MRPEDRERLAHVLKEVTIDLGLQPDQRHALFCILYKNLNLFNLGPTNLGRTPLVSHDIVTEAAPICQAAYRESHKECSAIKVEVQKLWEAGVASPLLSPWASPLVLVEKKDGNTCFCIDYRRLNAITKKDMYLLPKIDDTFDQLHGATIFSSVDLAVGIGKSP